MTTFCGPWPALITPTADDGGVNTSVLCALVDYLLDKKVRGFYLCGSTGEGIFQSPAERKLVVETAIKRVDGRVPCIVHVGAVATRDAVALARHARDQGASGISSILPLGVRGPESIHLHYQAITEATPELPFLPYMFGGQIDAVALIGELLERIPNLAGGKYTGPNMYELSRLVALRQENWTIFSGMDEQCLPAAMYGAPGNIGSTLNFMAGAYREIRASYEQGDTKRALDLQLRANRVTETVIAHGFAGARQEVMRLLGFDCGDPRLPNAPLPPEKRGDLRAALDAVGFDEMAAL